MDGSGFGRSAATAVVTRMESRVVEGQGAPRLGTLLNLLGCGAGSKDSPLAALRRVLTRLDNLSHCLLRASRLVHAHAHAHATPGGGRGDVVFIAQRSIHTNVLL